MGVTVTKPDTDMKALVRSHMGRVMEAMIKRLAEIGELAVADARRSGNYTDRTGNLRSSIGYVVANNGVVVARSSFDSVRGATEGPQTGLSLAESVASQSRGLVLVLVAGMHYAEYVADKGFNVLDSGRIIAERLIQQLSIPEVAW